jgi:hypothetical protein
MTEPVTTEPATTESAPVQPESQWHNFRKYRAHAHDGLCIIFRHANKEWRPCEKTGHYEDHFKLAADDLPRRVEKIMSEGRITPDQSWQALLAFDDEYERIENDLKAALKLGEPSGRHTPEKARRLLKKLPKVKKDFYKEVTSRKLGGISPSGFLIFDSLEATQSRVLAALSEPAEPASPAA